MYKITLSISLFLAPWWVTAQTAEDYFHGGAQNYIWGEKAKAESEIYTGLQKYPTDPQLNGLAVLLKKEEQKQQQNKQDQDKKDQQNKDQQSKQDQGQQNKDSQKQKEQQKEQAQKDKEKQKQSAEQKKKEQEKEQAQQSSGNPEDKDKQEGQPTYAAGQMTPQQAKQLLDAQKGQEMMLPIKPQGKPKDPNKPLRDW